MKFLAALLLCTVLLAGAHAQEGSATKGVAASTGLPVGQKAPVFTGQDQFGHEQSNETLRGSNGTVLLFFRSADW